MISLLFSFLLCLHSLDDFVNAKETRPPHPGSSRDAWSHSLPKRSSRNVPEAGYYDPNADGGSTLTKIPVTYPMGLGEPLNVIISGHSDDAVLVEQETEGGLLNYFISTGFSGECLGQTSGDRQAADLGDGNGTKNQTSLMRWNYGDPELGSCKESIQGGNHFRYWIQNGPKANSGAIFLAVSIEKPIAQGHDIVLNGYNFGRDLMIGNISQTAIPTSTLTNTSEYSGKTSFGGYTYETQVKYVSGLLGNTSDGVNHQYSVGSADFNAMDGLVAVFTVSITDKPQPANGSLPAASWSAWVIYLIPIISLVFTFQ